MSWLKAKDWATGVEYSSLFHSGLRTISLTSPDRRVRASSSSSSRKRNSSASSEASLPSRSLRRSLTRTHHPRSSFSTSTESSPSRPSSMFVRPPEEMEDAWSRGATFLEDHPRSVEEMPVRAGCHLPPIELEVRPLGGSRPYFVDLVEMDGVEDETCLSVSNSPDGFLHRPVSRRSERPVSTQTGSTLSRRPSLHYRTLDKGDRAWMLEESSPELKVYDVGEADDERDWRQFHVDWVRDIR